MESFLFANRNFIMLKPTLKYFPHLDGIRLIAALMVVFNHYLTELNFGFKFPTGFYGVQIFFAISGFLITGILLTLKNLQPAVSYVLIIKNFYIKRFLRLFPPYYILIFSYVVLEFFGLFVAQPGWKPFYMLYVPNWFFYYYGWQGTIDNHLWSLGVEEQFYLFWPILLLLLPKRSEHKWIIAMIVTGYFLKAIINQFFLLEGDPFLLPISQMDTIGIGALLACAYHYQLNFLTTAKRWLPFLLPIAILLTLYTSYDKPRNDPFLCISLVLLSGSIVLRGVEGFSGVIKKVMEWKWVQYGGKISYGIYLYHKVIPTLLVSFSHKLGILHPNKTGVLLLSLILTFVIAHLSWIWLETPFLRMKKYFEISVPQKIL